MAQTVERAEAYLIEGNTMSAFTRAIENKIGDLIVSPGLCADCVECQRDYGLTADGLAAAYESGELFDEGGFSWHCCESCGSTFGGNRFSAHYLDGTAINHLLICEDCLLYFSSGYESRATR